MRNGWLVLDLRRGELLVWAIPGISCSILAHDGASVDPGVLVVVVGSLMVDYRVLPGVLVELTVFMVVSTVGRERSVA